MAVILQLFEDVVDVLDPEMNVADDDDEDVESFEDSVIEYRPVSHQEAVQGEVLTEYV